MPCALPSYVIRDTIEFHGHSCPGLAIGIRAAELALREIEAEGVVAVVETDMCGVDALQYILGCTFGKGDIIHRDYGKIAFSFWNRETGEGFRALFRNDFHDQEEYNELRDLMPLVDSGKATPEQAARKDEIRKSTEDRLMAADLDDIFIVTPTENRPPRPARVLQSLSCDHCGEHTMESRTRRFAGETLCIPCFEKVEQKV